MEREFRELKQIDEPLRKEMVELAAEATDHSIVLSRLVLNGTPIGQAKGLAPVFFEAAETERRKRRRRRGKRERKGRLIDWSIGLACLIWGGLTFRYGPLHLDQVVGTGAAFLLLGLFLVFRVHRFMGAWLSND